MPAAVVLRVAWEACTRLSLHSAQCKNGGRAQRPPFACPHTKAVTLLACYARSQLGQRCYSERCEMGNRITVRGNGIVQGTDGPNVLVKLAKNDSR